MITIYALVDPRDDKYKYVGRTTNPKYRLVKHKSPQTGVGTPKNEWIRELRAAGFKPIMEVLMEVETKDEAGFWERHYTDLFRSWGFDLLNNLYRMFGNQTSFHPDKGWKPVVAINTDGTLFKVFPSIKSTYTYFNSKICVPQCLMKIKKKAAGYIWFYEEEYKNMTQEQVDKHVQWCNTNGRKQPKQN